MALLTKLYPKQIVMIIKIKTDESDKEQITISTEEIPSSYLIHNNTCSSSNNNNKFGPAF